MKIKLSEATKKMAKMVAEGKMSPLQKDVKNMKFHLEHLSKKYPEYKDKFLAAKKSLEGIEL